MGKFKDIVNGVKDIAKNKIEEMKEDRERMSDFNRELKIKEKMEIAEMTSKMKVEAKKKSMTEKKKIFS